MVNQKKKSSLLPFKFNLVTWIINSGYFEEKNQSYRIGIEVSGAKSVLTLGKSFTTLNPDFPPAGFEEAGVDPRFAGLVKEENVSLAGEVGDDVVILCGLFLAVKDLLSSPES